MDGDGRFDTRFRGGGAVDGERPATDLLEGEGHERRPVRPCRARGTVRGSRACWWNSSSAMALRVSCTLNARSPVSSPRIAMNSVEGDSVSRFAARSPAGSWEPSGSNNAASATTSSRHRRNTVPDAASIRSSNSGSIAAWLRSLTASANTAAWSNPIRPAESAASTSGSIAASWFATARRRRATPAGNSAARRATSTSRAPSTDRSPAGRAAPRADAPRRRRRTGGAAPTAGSDRGAQSNRDRRRQRSRGVTPPCPPTAPRCAPGHRPRSTPPNQLHRTYVRHDRSGL